MISAEAGVLEQGLGRAPTRPGRRAALAAAWLILVEPGRGWGLIKVRSLPASAFLAQWTLVCAGWSISATAWAELSRSAGLASPGAGLRVASWFLGLLTIAVLLASSLLALALVAKVALQLAGLRVTLRQALNLTAFSLTPAFLGRALGLALLTVVSPLAATQTEALQLQLAPAPLGATAFAAALSLPWVVLAFFDLFGIWSICLYWTGLRRYLHLSPPRAAWALATLVLSWLLILTAVWQGINRGLP